MNETRVTVTLTDVVSTGEAAKALGVTRVTIWRWIQAGKITPIMLDKAYFHKNEVERLKRLRNANDQGQESKVGPQ